MIKNWRWYDGVVMGFNICGIVSGWDTVVGIVAALCAALYWLHMQMPNRIV